MNMMPGISAQLALSMVLNSQRLSVFHDPHVWRFWSFWSHFSYTLPDRTESKKKQQMFEHLESQPANEASLYCLSSGYVLARTN